MAYKKFKIHGRSRPSKTKRTSAPVSTPVDQTQIPPSAHQYSAADLEVLKKCEEVHVFMTQRGLPYILIARTPDSAHPAGKFSFNHEHNKPEQTMRNAEWIFATLGNMIDRTSNGIVRLFKFY